MGAVSHLAEETTLATESGLDPLRSFLLAKKGGLGVPHRLRLIQCERTKTNARHMRLPTALHCIHCIQKSCGALNHPIHSHMNHHILICPPFLRINTPPPWRIPLFYHPFALSTLPLYSTLLYHDYCNYYNYYNYNSDLLSLSSRRHHSTICIHT